MPESKLLKKIEEDLKRAILKRDQTKISALRMLITDIHNQEIAKKKRGKLDDEQIIEVIQRRVKKHKDSIEAFKKGARWDLVEKEKKEMEILVGYLPKQLTKEEIKKIVKSVIAKLKVSSITDMGKVMGMVMSQIKGKAEGKLVSQIVKEQLSK